MIGYSQQIVVANREADQRLLGVRLGRYCIVRDIPVTHVAQYFNVTRQTVYNWFLGIHAPGKLQAEKIEEFFSKVI